MLVVLTVLLSTAAIADAALALAVAATPSQQQQ